MAELKPCPFCAKKVKTIVKVETQTIVKAETLRMRESYIDFTIVCLGCGITKTVRVNCGISGASFLDVEKAMNEVVLAWNRRAGEDG